MNLLQFALCHIDQLDVSMIGTQSFRVESSAQAAPISLSTHPHSGKSGVIFEPEFSYDKHTVFVYSS